jgi:Na+/H+ antiporter NhaD/arsenite permease-like protein
MTSGAWISLASFLVCYALFVALPKWRSVTACAGAVVLVLSGTLTWREALLQYIHWNVIALFFGTLVLAELFMQSRMPAVLAEWLVDKTRTARAAMIAVCVLASVLSMFVENVAVILLVAPVALSLAEKLKLSPVRLLICIAVSTNLQGTATLIGDPPSMILAGYMKMSFNDFFIYHGKPGIFFAIQAGMVASMIVVAWLLRQHRQNIELLAVERVRSWTPTVLLGVLIAGLAATSVYDPDFKWLAGTFTMTLAVAGLVWYRLGPRWSSTRDLIQTLDYDTTFFLMGVFVLVGALSDSGWLDKVAEWIAGGVGNNVLAAYVVIITVSVVLSAFVDNVPFLLAMIPVTQKVSDHLGVPVALLVFGLLIGSCLGGNITPIGASANIVTCGLLRKQGHLVTFREFMAVGVPFTLAAVLAGAVFVWFIWAP